MLLRLPSSSVCPLKSLTQLTRQIDAAAGGHQKLHRIHVALAIRLHFNELRLLVRPLCIQNLNISGVACPCSDLSSE
jgi:hypothetical protein